MTERTSCTVPEGSGSSISVRCHPILLGAYLPAQPGVVHYDDMAVEGATAYLLADPGGLQIADISDPTNPELVSIYRQ